ncbi:hypothetical protein C8R44DRAFT_878855 [Mycena epipterygia]|nr:hypothetical protein C8R44DRAFT_878855 [Mycena epipterygia]
MDNSRPFHATSRIPDLQLFRLSEVIDHHPLINPPPQRFVPFAPTQLASCASSALCAHASARLTIAADAATPGGCAFSAGGSFASSAHSHTHIGARRAAYSLYPTPGFVMRSTAPLLSVFRTPHSPSVLDWHRMRHVFQPSISAPFLFPRLHLLHTRPASSASDTLGSVPLQPSLPWTTLEL